MHSQNGAGSLTPEQKQALKDATELREKFAGLSQGRAASRMRRRAVAAARRTATILPTRGTGDQHRAWRAAGRVGNPADY